MSPQTERALSVFLIVLNTVGFVFFALLKNPIAFINLGAILALAYELVMRRRA